MNVLIDIKKLCQRKIKSADQAKKFYKTGPGEYGEHDQFLGIPVPALRKIAKDYADLPRENLQHLIQSPFNEERLLALLILIIQYQRREDDREAIYHFYLQNINYVNNWNLVDSSAHYIIGAHLFNADKKLLITLANSEDLWKRRIAIISTWYFIRHHQFDDTIKIAELLLSDSHDLIHKAVGWMLREMGKRNKTLLLDFLTKHVRAMPGTMFRYATEKLSAVEKSSIARE